MGLMAAASIDAPDAAGLARFYADLLGWEVTYEGPEGAMASGDGKNLLFQQVSDYNAPQWPDPQHPQQAHLDLLFDDLAAGGARAVELGATDLESGDSAVMRYIHNDPFGFLAAPLDATGKRLRDLPLTRKRIKDAIDA